MSPKNMEVRIAGMAVRVPVYKSEPETLALVERVNAKIREFEEASARVNTQMFALQAAYAFALEAAATEDEVVQREDELLERIAALAADVEKLRDEVDESV